jgi:DNA-binding NtrC family response regulator
VSRVLLHEPIELENVCRPQLGGGDRDVVVCRTREALVQALADRRPDVVVYVLQDLARDLDLLAAVRRMAPTLPLILLGGPADLASRRNIQELKPLYYGVFPLERTELSEAVMGALERGGARA